MFNLNLHTALKRDRDKSIDSHNFDLFIKDIFRSKSSTKDRLKNNLKSKNNSSPNHLNFDELETEKIFHIETIRKLCIRYRLRFLDTNLFKGDYPSELFNIIPELEKRHETEFENFKIMAPSKLFRLRVKEDPLLFVPIGNDYYYLIHKWGRDLKTYRRWLVWPFKNINTLIFSSIFLSLISTALWSACFNSFSDVELFVIFVFNIKTFVFITFYLFFMMRKNFNESIWNSKYKN
tara:strand:+ start:34409 stop:35113 length:705 start_codon:yes stop_codon:yes gene_type:complete